MTWLLDWMLALWHLLVDAGVWLLVGFVIAGLFSVLVPASLVRKQLGGRGVWPVLKASAIGVPMPLCSCAVIPAAAAIRRGGASKGASAAFAISTPEIDVPGISLTYALIGPVMAIARPIVALITAIAAGVTINLFDRPGGDGRSEADSEPSLDDAGGASGTCCSSSPEASACGCSSQHASEPAGSCCASASEPEPVASCCAGQAAPASSCCGSMPAAQPESPCCSSSAPARREGVLERSLRYSFGTLPKDLARWIVLGLALSALVVVLIPDGWIEANLESGVLGPTGSKLLMLAIGIPWYVCATASTPLAAVLIAKGLSPGAALVFLLAGPATNPATMGWVIKDLGGRALVVYLVSISALGLAAGFALDALVPAEAFRQAAQIMVHEHAGLIDQIAAGVLALTLAVGLVRSFRLPALLGPRPKLA